MTRKTEKSAATADDEVEIIDDDTDDTVEVDDAPASGKPKAEAAPDDDEDRDDGDEEAEGDDKPDDPVKAEQKRKLQAQKRARNAEREARDLRARIEQLEQSVGSVRELEVAREQEAAQERLRAAEQAYVEAHEDGDPSKMLEATRKLRKVEAEAERLDQSPKRQQAQPTASANPHRDKFLEKHDDWFDPSSHDEDSAVVRSLSAALVQQGVDPNTEAHFDQLEKRMRKFLPHRFKDTKAPARQTSAASSAGRRSGGEEGNGKLKIHGQTIRGFKQEHGLDWHDPDPERRAAARKAITSRVIEARRNRGEVA